MLFYKLHFVGLVPVLHELNGLSRRQLEAFERQRFLNYLLHLGLDTAKVFGGKRLVDIEIVIESVVYCGPDGKFRLWIQAFYRLGEDVRSSMVEGTAALFVVESQYFERAVAFERSAQVAHLSVYFCRTGRFVQAGPETLGDVERGRAAGVFAFLSALQCYF